MSMAILERPRSPIATSTSMPATRRPQKKQPNEPTLTPGRTATLTLILVPVQQEQIHSFRRIDHYLSHPNRERYQAYRKQGSDPSLPGTPLSISRIVHWNRNEKRKVAPLFPRTIGTKEMFWRITRDRTASD